MKQPRNETDREWAGRQIGEFKRLLPRYQEQARTLEKILRSAASDIAPLAIIQTRPKSVASFSEKIQRKKHKYDDPVNQITDLCGGRIITHTRSEVAGVCDFIKQHFEVDWGNSLDLSERLKPTEFGYRSVHYVVTLRPEVFPCEAVDVDIPSAVFPDDGAPMKAELQVRTLLEHTWADINHDLTYKSSFTVPDRWQRELAGLAAMLERADDDFFSIRQGLEKYASSYGTYMSEQQMKKEINLLELVLEHDPDNLDVVSRIGKLAMALGDWNKAIGLLDEHREAGHREIERDLGVALCKLHEDEPRSKRYLLGQECLEAACHRSEGDVDALASLAGTWRGLDDDKARSLYRQAFELDPTDPYPLGNYLELEIAHRGDLSVLSVTGHLIRQAIERGNELAAVGTSLPWSLYDVGKLHLLLGHTRRSLTAYSRALALTTDVWMIDTSIRSLDYLAPAQDSLPGYEAARRLLLVARARLFPSQDALAKVAALASPAAESMAEPVILVAGGWDEPLAVDLSDRRSFLEEAFGGFEGTVIASGIAGGIGNLVGRAQEKYPQTVKTRGYAPSTLPAGLTVDDRYGELIRTSGSEVSILEPLQAWIDMTAAGIEPSQIKVLGINGGPIATTEYEIAIAFDVRPAIFAGSGLGPSHQADGSNRRALLLEDSAAARAFLELNRSGPGESDRDSIAQAIHDNYTRFRASNPQNHDPSMAPWDQLAGHLKDSNRQQADAIYRKLERIGCATRRVGNRVSSDFRFTDAEVEILAEAEHARWHVDRLLDGWILGDEKDPAAKISPDLMAWDQLTDETKNLDRNAVLRIPEVLASVGLEVYRL